MDVVELREPDGGVIEVNLASSFTDRLLGLRRVEPDSGLLLRARSVHGFGMTRPFLAVGMDGNGRVVGSTVVKPWRMVWFRRCRWVLEMPERHSPPAIGEMLEWARA